MKGSPTLTCWKCGRAIGPGEPVLILRWWHDNPDRGKSGAADFWYEGGDFCRGCWPESARGARRWERNPEREWAARSARAIKEEKRNQKKQDRLEWRRHPSAYSPWQYGACEACGRLVYRRRAYQYLWWYCSRTCANRLFARRRRARRAARRWVPVIPCEVCLKAFRPRRADARTCSAACRQKAHRERKRSG
jgi:hypothetical protein